MLVGTDLQRTLKVQAGLYRAHVCRNSRDMGPNLKILVWNSRLLQNCYKYTVKVEVYNIFYLNVFLFKVCQTNLNIKTQNTAL